MSVNKIPNVNTSYDYTASKTKTTQTKTTEKVKQDTEDAAAAYEKSENTQTNKKVYQRDNDTIDRMLEESEKRAQSLRDLVEKMLLKQGETFSNSTDIYKLLREGKVQADPETSKQAQKDIAEDGYWGTKQTSDRLVSFAKALTGGDPSKADKMIAAVKKGFEQATKAWGDELPGICKDTMDSAISKLEQWRDSKQEDDSMSKAAEDTFKNQAASAKAAK